MSVTDTQTDTAPRTTYLVVDGENIDATLGNSIFHGRPLPEQRPRWDRVLDYARSVWDQPVNGLFFLNASSGTLPFSFVQALTGIGYTPVPLSGPADVKVVDVGVKRTLEALLPRDADVLLISHDGDFELELEALTEETGRRTGLLSFREFTSVRLMELTARNMEFHDLEYDVGAFQVTLPRLRIIPLEEFDPVAFL